MLPWLAEEPLAAAAARTAADRACPWRSPQCSASSHYRALLESVRYMLLRGCASPGAALADAVLPDAGAADRSRAAAALTAAQAKQVTFFLRDAFVAMAEHDVGVVHALDAHDETLLRMGTRQLALAAVKSYDSHDLSADELAAARARVQRVDTLMATKPKLATDAAGAQLSLNNMAAAHAEAALFPYWDRVVWQVRCACRHSVPIAPTITATTIASTGLTDV
jgi:hypothetical protein